MAHLPTIRLKAIINPRLILNFQPSLILNSYLKIKIKVQVAEYKTVQAVVNKKEITHLPEPP